jgi:hypothetical protein
MNNAFSWSSRLATSQVLIVLLLSAVALAEELVPGKIVEISFPDANLPPTLFTMMTGTATAPCLTVRLPDDYSPANSYPLLVYVPGFHGGPKGNIANARSIAGTRGWIVASLPLFKSHVDRDEPAGGVLVSLEDYPILSKAYAIMLGRLFELVPNIDREKSAMVGFSNGAITIGVLVSSHDEFTLTHFRNFCLVDHGMFHLTDLHKRLARGCRFLVLVGDKKDYERDLMTRGSQLLQDSWRLLGVDLTHQLLKDTGHEFADRHMKVVGKWLRQEVAMEPAAEGGAARQGP